MKRIINPWQFAIALSEVAIQNGVELRLNEEVTSIKKDGDIFIVNDTYKAPLVVNCAGVMCDHVTGLIKKPDYKITPNKGELFIR